MTALYVMTDQLRSTLVSCAPVCWPNLSEAEREDQVAALALWLAWLTDMYAPTAQAFRMGGPIRMPTRRAPSGAKRHHREAHTALRGAPNVLPGPDLGFT